MPHIHEREDKEPSWQIGSNDVWPNTEGNYNNDEMLQWDPDADRWHIGQCYVIEKARQVMCAKCKGNRFQVAQSDYWTGIKCERCGWELCVHEG